jgi:general secretion pathway protein A
MYLEHFGLKEQPFNITPDPRFLFYSAKHREAFDHLLYGIDQRKGFIELVGEVGAGKTTLCRAVLSALPDTVRSALVLNPAVSENQLLRAILQDFGLNPKGRDRMAHIDQLNAFLLDQMNAGHNVVLIIDEAQDLQEEVLEQIRLLNNLETDQYKLMQIILAGQPELKRKLDQKNLRQFKQRIMVRCHLNVLNQEETGEYIRHRLCVAGANPDVYFDPAAIKLIYKKAKGTPRMINALCDNAMLAAFVAGTPVVRAPEVRRAIQHIGG